MFAKSAIAASLLVSVLSSIVMADDFGIASMAGDPVNASVGQMLAIDAQRALVMEQKMLDAANATKGGAVVQGAAFDVAPTAAPEPVAPQLPITLDGIFGIGNSLMADVMIGNTRVRYQRGKALPVGVPPGFPYQLVSIDVPCVKLRNTSNVEQTICLSKSGL